MCFVAFQSAKLGFNCAFFGGHFIVEVLVRMVCLWFYPHACRYDIMILYCGSTHLGENVEQIGALSCHGLKINASRQL